MSVYVVLTIVWKKGSLDVFLFALLQVLSPPLFKKMPIQKAFLDGDHTSGSRGLFNRRIYLEP